MSEPIAHPRSQRMHVVFSYGEHEALRSSDDPDMDEPEVQIFVRFVREREWEDQGPVATDLSHICDPDIQSLDDLMNLTQELFGNADDASDELVQIPFAKLAALMVDGGWSFVGGSFMEFEGHHNDTEITVVLERTLPEA